MSAVETRRIRSLLRRLFGDDDGQSLVELALALPIFLVVLVGAVEFSDAWRSFNTVVHSAREGVRIAVVPTGTEDQVRAVIQNQMTAAGLDYSADQVSLSCDGGGGLCTATGTEDVVRIEYEYEFLFLGPLVELVCNGAGCGGNDFGSVVLRSEARGRNE